MNWRKLTLVACVGGLLSVLPICVASINVSKLTQRKQPPILSLKQLQQQAQGITVKVMSKSEVLGSGILLKKGESFYTIVTNAHVLRAGNPPYRIQTSDDHIWQAELPKGVEKLATTKGNDLALLQFRSTGIVYPVASFGSFPKSGDDVFASGFPSVEEGKQENFAFTTGKVSLVLQKALEGGYQVGYTNDIQLGMSGGPLLNRQGKVIAVNGMHANPIWDVPSIFADGSEADSALHQKIVHLSWGVPIKTLSGVHQ